MHFFRLPTGIIFFFVTFTQPVLCQEHTDSLFDGRQMGRWENADFYGSGHVEVKDGAIVMEKGVEQTGIRWTGPVLRCNYRINLEAKRIEGKDFFCGLTFPVGDSFCSLIVGGWGGKTVGLSNIDLLDAAENETTVLLEFELNQWYPIRLEVTDDRIAVWIEGDKIIDVNITGRIIATRPEVDLCKPLGIMTWQTTGAIRKITLTDLSNLMENAKSLKVRHLSEMTPAEQKALARQILKDPDLPKALEMALETARSGLTAGVYYPQVWIRDLNTFLELASKTHPQEEIRKTLITFFAHQGEDGNIIDGFAVQDGKTHKNTVETDQESSLIQAVYTYIKVSGDRGFLTQQIKGQTVARRMEMALEYLLNHRFNERYGLLWGATTVDWGDVQPETGWGTEFTAESHKTIDIYDNAMFVIALQRFIELTDQPEGSNWNHVLTRTENNIRAYLWKEDKFLPHLYLNGSPFPDNFNENRIHYHGGTAVAIQAGLLNYEQVRSVIRQMIENKHKAGAQSIGVAVYPAYPKGFFKNPMMVKPYGYQNGGDWTWFGGRMIEQMAGYGYMESAYREAKPMVQRVIENKGFLEWYTLDGKPKGSPVYRGSAGALAGGIRSLLDWANKRVEGNP
ncbi:MAG: DUF1080 domain-containing protein [Sedimentisphaerales bacterium]|nr:DUF1080 domain-containing protein [Sedimentisphaerales bacterium]